MPFIRRMFQHFCLTCFIACLFCGCQRTDTATTISERDAGEASPSARIPDYSIWRPFFFTEFGNQAIDEIQGTAFAVKAGAKDKVFLVTALHLLGPAGGLTRQIEPGKIHQLVNEVVTSETFGATDANFILKLPIEPPIKIRDKDYWLQADILLLPGEGSKARYRTLELSSESPKLGDSIWLVTAVFGGAPASDKTHAATVVDVDDAGGLRYEFKNLDLILKAADGAPLVDAEGRVVGMHQNAIVSDASSATDADATPSPPEASAARSPVLGKGVAVKKLHEVIEIILPPEANMGS